MEVESSGGNGLFAAASLAACCARASIVQTVPVIAAAAPITALRMRNVRRSIFSGRFDSAGNSGNRGSLFVEDVSLIVVPAGFCWLVVELIVRFKFLAALVSLALDCVDVTVGAGLYVGGVSFIGVDVHGEFKTRIYSHQHVSKNQFAVSRDTHPHERLIADSVTKRVLRAHVNMPQRANDAVINLDAAGGTLKRAAGRVRNIAAFTDRRMNAELELLGHRDLHLRIFPRGPKNADTLNTTFRSDDRELLLTCILPGLREIGVLGELMSFAEQSLDMLLGEMNMMGRDLDEKRFLLLRLQHARDIGAA